MTQEQIEGREEYAIGEEFQIGAARFRCEKSDGTCTGCFFENTICPITLGYCSSRFRTDKTDVIFKEI